MRVHILHLRRGTVTFSLEIFRIPGYVISEVEIDANQDVTFGMVKYGFGGSESQSFSYTHRKTRNLPCRRFFTLYRNGMHTLDIYCSVECTLVLRYSESPYSDDNPYAKKLREIQQKAEDNYYQKFYEKKGRSYLLLWEKFLKERFHYRDRKWEELFTSLPSLRETKWFRPNRVNEISRRGEYLHKIQIEPVEQMPTKCCVFSNNNEVFSFDLNPKQKEYTLFLAVGWLCWSIAGLKFDAEVYVTFYFSHFPHQIRELSKLPVVTRQFGCQQLYMNGMLGTPSQKFLEENGYL